MKESFPEGKSDLFAAFIQRCTGLASKRGLSAMITMQSWMFLSSFEKLRRSLLCNQWIVSMLHLGTRAFDSIGGEVVSSTAFVIENVPPSRRGTASTRCGSFVRIVDGKSEAEKIVMLDRARHTREARDGFHGASPEDFTVIPGSPIVYWLSEKMRTTFKEGRSLGEMAELLVGLRTGDNTRFLRFWWEVAQDRTTLDCTSLAEAKASGRRWFPYNKGGSFRRWYGNHEYVVNWENDGREIEEGLAERYPYMVPAGQSVLRGQGRSRYFSPSVSWSDISSGEAAFRRYPGGFIHDSTGHSGFGEPSTLDRVAILMNSTFAAQALQVLAPTMHFHIGYVGQVPVASDVERLCTERMDKLVERSKRDWDEYETSWDFRSNPLVTIGHQDAFELR